MKDNKKRILVVSERFYPEEFIINDLVSEWHKNGYNVSVLTQVPSYPFGKVFNTYKNRWYYKDNWNGVDVYRFRTIQGYKNNLFLKIFNYINFVFLGSLVAFFIGRKFDKIFVYQTGPLTLALPAILIKKLYGKEITLWTQDLWPESVYAYGFKKSLFLSSCLDSFVRFIYGNCKQIFFPCEGQKKSILNYVKDKNMHYIPNWALFENSDNKHTVILSDKFNFTFAGNIGKVQNLENVIKGFVLAQKEINSIQLNIIGDGSFLEHLRKMVKDEKIDNVVFWGRKKANEIPAYLNASDVLIISLIDDPIFEVTIPSKFQTYLMAEKPLFCVMNGELRNIVEKHNLGHCASPSDIDDIKNKFLEFNKIDAKNLVFNIKKIQGTFDRKKAINDLTDLFLL
mgnify:CR=1 FL=1